MTSETAPIGADWLALREPADAEARAPELVEELRSVLPATGLVVHDLGCGTGSMARWLAPRLAGAQHWVLHDRDADLLDRVAADPPWVAADGADVSVETRLGDITRLDPDQLAGAGLVTASALIDIMTADELDRFVRSCAEVGCPVLVTLSVVGRVEVVPPDPLDREVEAAFNAHQQRATSAGALLGPAAPEAAVEAFTGLGLDVTVRDSPWLLGPARADLAAEWCTGWVGAAVEQRPELRDVAEDYLRRRLDQAQAGSLSVTVHHQDLLALPVTPPGRPPGGETPTGRADRPAGPRS